MSILKQAEDLVKEYKEKFEEIDTYDICDSNRYCEDCAHLKTKAKTLKEASEDFLEFLKIHKEDCESVNYISQYLEEKIKELKQAIKLLKEIK